jgi:hypothetical protein
MPRLRVPFLALPLFLALAQGCFAQTPSASWSTQILDRMRLDDCVRWGARALEQTGFSVTPTENDLYGYKGVHIAVLICGAAPVVTIVVASNGKSGDASSEHDALRDRFPLESRMHERDRRR